MQNLLCCLAAASLLLGVCQCMAAVTPGQVETLLKQLPPAPRLLLKRSDEADLRRRIAQDPQLTALWQLVQHSADAMLTEPLVKRELLGRRLLGQSRACLRRMTHLGLAYRLTGDRRYAERARQDMLAAAAFSDWNPAHFLDTAEMTAALAIGVDWMGDAFDQPARQTIREAIVRLGLEPSMGNPYWATNPNNWNQVCNTGMALGALVVADDHRELATQVIARAVNGVPHAMKEYAPDGAYPEGPMYWEYGTSFNVLLIAALEQALGTDFGLGATPGFDKTAQYFLQVTSPTGLWFNYADASQRSSFAPAAAMFHFSTRLKDPGLLFVERRMLVKLLQDPASVSPEKTDRLLPLALLWAPAPAASASEPARHYVGRGTTPVAVFRSGWDPQATFAGIKGGQANAPHGHMDAGTFVLDMKGQRFVEDLGMQNYHSLEVLGLRLFDRGEGADRWKIFRLGAASHSVLIVDGKSHVLGGRAEIVTSTDTSAKLDLSPVYAGQLASAARELRLQHDGSVTVTDQVQAPATAVTVRWTIVTAAEVALDRSGALLTRGGRRVRLQIDGIEGSSLESRPADPPPAAYDAPNPGIRIVSFQLRLQPHERQSWTARFSPVD